MCTMKRPSSRANYDLHEGWRSAKRNPRIKIGGRGHQNREATPVHERSNSAIKCRKSNTERWMLVRYPAGGSARTKISLASSARSYCKLGRRTQRAIRRESFISFSQNQNLSADCAVLLTQEQKYVPGEQRATAMNRGTILGRASSSTPVPQPVSALDYEAARFRGERKRKADAAYVAAACRCPTKPCGSNLLTYWKYDNHRITGLLLWAIVNSSRPSRRHASLVAFHFARSLHYPPVLLRSLTTLCYPSFRSSRHAVRWQREDNSARSLPRRGAAYVSTAAHPSRSSSRALPSTSRHLFRAENPERPRFTNLRPRYDHRRALKSRFIHVASLGAGFRGSGAWWDVSDRTSSDPHPPCPLLLYVVIPSSLWPTRSTPPSEAGCVHNVMLDGTQRTSDLGILDAQSD
ncbi:hypothetical protein FB451DRAFT_1360158 [Mycena latifolia]|nr:hypothetical protein FB451DRAFT_1360158 [Mycena latifolia]